MQRAIWQHRTPTGTILGDELEEPSLAAELKSVTADFRAHRHAIKVFTEGRFRATYRAQALGLLWPIANPLILMIVISVVFGWVFPTEIPAYPVFLMLGLIPWHFLSHSWTDGTTCLLEHAEVLKRTSVPGYVIAAGTVFSHLHNLGFASLSILPLIALYPSAFQVSLAMLALPLVLVFLVVATLGLVLISGVLNVVYRDVGYIVNSSLVVLFWATPIMYPLDRVAGTARRILLLNPMASIIESTRAIVMDGRFPAAGVTAAAAASSGLILLIGLLLYRRFARQLADHV
jgi:ABC-type polysaccharide/polyol phosphate export permease